MNYPNFSEEKKLWKQGINMVVGLDEAGRGPLAGPVVAAAVCIKPQTLMINDQSNSKKSKSKNISGIKSLGFNWGLGIGNWDFGIRDSKQLSEKKREELYKILTSHNNISWGIGIVSEKVIDKINILRATKLAMQKAILDISCNSHGRENYKSIDFLLIDGNFTLPVPRGMTSGNFGQKSIIKGDQKVFSIAAASIIAKVTRDRIMQNMHKKYPEYRFDLHKGYGTALHIANLRQFGPSNIHRKTFYPVSNFN